MCRVTPGSATGTPSLCAANEQFCAPLPRSDPKTLLVPPFADVLKCSVSHSEAPAGCASSPPSTQSWTCLQRIQDRHGEPHPLRTPCFKARGRHLRLWIHLSFFSGVDLAKRPSCIAVRSAPVSVGRVTGSRTVHGLSSISVPVHRSQCIPRTRETERESFQSTGPCCHNKPSMLDAFLLRCTTDSTWSRVHTGSPVSMVGLEIQGQGVGGRGRGRGRGQEQGAGTEDRG